MLNERGRRDHGGGGALYGTCLTYLTALTNSHYEPAEARSKSVTGCQPAHSENPVRLFSHGTRDNVNDLVEILLSSKWALASVRLRVPHLYIHDDTVDVMSHLASFASLTCVRPLHCKLAMAALGAAIEAGIAT